MEKEESSADKIDSSEKLRKKSNTDKSTLQLKLSIEERSATKPMATMMEQAGASNKPSPLSFDTYLPWACKLFHVDVNVQSGNVAQTQTTHDRSMKMKKSKKNIAIFGDDSAVAFATPSDTKDKSSKSSSFMGKGFFIAHKAIQILATYDPHHNLIKINLCNNREVPRTLLIILSLIVHFYPALSVLTVNSGINEYSIYEISKFLPKSTLREIYLDGTVIKNPNYHMLLETASHLTCLSLARCEIADEGLRRITDLLAFPLPAAKTLTFLNLSSNKISDKGAEYLAEALRTNRQLAYLNLANNHITDTGAFYIFNNLLEFPLRIEEMVESKFRRLRYIKQKMALVAQFVAELKTAEEMKAVKKRTVGVGAKSNKRLSLEIKEPQKEIKTVAVPDRKLAEKAESLATKTLGEYKDPFKSPATFTKNEKFYCVGNTVLVSLNLSHNNLSYVSLKKLLEVLNYQRNNLQKPTGLFRVRIEGNYLPKTCNEYAEIYELLNASLDFQQIAPKKKSTVNK